MGIHGASDELDIGRNILVNTITNTEWPTILVGFICRYVLIKKLGNSQYDIVFVVMRDLNSKLIFDTKEIYGSESSKFKSRSNDNTGRMYSLSSVRLCLFKGSIFTVAFKSIGVRNCHFYRVLSGEMEFLRVVIHLPWCNIWKYLFIVIY